MKRYKVKVAQQVLETAEVEVVVPADADAETIEKIAIELANNKDDLEWFAEGVDQTYVLRIEELDA